MKKSLYYENLLSLSDEKYRHFTAKLTPGIDKDTIIGVRVPVLRKFAKDIISSEKEKMELFIEDLPHSYYDENNLHSLILSEMKDPDVLIFYIDKYLPHLNNWASCDLLSPKVFKENKDVLLKNIKKWMKSDEEFTLRFSICMLMQFFLDDDFKDIYHKKVSEIKSEHYYVKMMIAWYFAEALAKKREESIVYFEKRILDKWTHNKAIQKAIESRKISDKDKEYLKKMKI